MLFGVVSYEATAGERAVTVQELFRFNHRIEIEKGTRVIFADTHFDRVWFPKARGAVVQRTDAGLSVIFAAPGEYRGTFTVVGGHATTDVYPLIVIVK
jgi:hypothetical protein